MTQATLKVTPLNAAHRAAGAKMVDFGGWDMPVNYGSQIEEHHAVRTDVGMFDVSHMCVVDLKKLSDKYVELTENDGQGPFWWVKEQQDEDDDEIPLPILALEDTYPSVRRVRKQ